MYIFDIVHPFSSSIASCPSEYVVHCVPRRLCLLLRSFPPNIWFRLQRLPADFDPFLVKQVNSERVHSEAAQDIDGDFRSVGCALRVIYSVFSSRAWDRLYLFLGLLWSVLCPGHLDGAIESVEREHLALVLLMMFVLVVTPIVSTVLFKAFFSSELRPCLRNSGKSAVRIESNLPTQLSAVCALNG